MPYRVCLHVGTQLPNLPKRKKSFRTQNFSICIKMKYECVTDLCSSLSWHHFCLSAQVALYIWENGKGPHLTAVPELCTEPEDSARAQHCVTTVSREPPLCVSVSDRRDSPRASLSDIGHQSGASIVKSLVIYTTFNQTFFLNVDEQKTGACWDKLDLVLRQGRSSAFAKQHRFVSYRLPVFCLTVQFPNCPSLAVDSLDNFLSNIMGAIILDWQLYCTVVS